MKKLLTLSMLLASIAFTAFSTEAKMTAANPNPSRTKQTLQSSL